MQVLKPEIIKTETSKAPSFLTAKHSDLNYKESARLHVLCDNVGHPFVSPHSMIEELKEFLNPLSTTIKTSDKVIVRNPGVDLKIPAKQLREDQFSTYFKRTATVFKTHDKVEINGKKGNFHLAFTHDYNIINNIHNQAVTIAAGILLDVCANQCIFGDSIQEKFVFNSMDDFKTKLEKFINGINHDKMIETLESFHSDSPEECLSNTEIKTLFGALALYKGAPAKVRKDMPLMPLLDSHQNKLSEFYWADKDFPTGENYTSIWTIYNHMTNSLKNSPINTLLPRLSTITTFMQGINEAKRNPQSPYNWFLN